MDLLIHRSGVAVAVLVGLVLIACDGSKTYAGHGIVQQVMLEDRQAVIAHDEIPGLMPAMTMSFGVYDAALLASLKPGDVIDFVLTAQRGRFFVSGVKVLGKVDPAEGWSRMGDGLVKSDPAPAFELIRVPGETVSLTGLGGKTVLLDFIFTRCAGPCPTLTSSKVAVQRGLSPGARERSHFVSISIDPARDTPEDLRAYGQARGADLATWSFLTGEQARVQEVLAAYGVATANAGGDDLEHVLATFLIDPRGRIVKRYIGLDHDPQTIIADIEAVVFPAG
jgi:protein SCO1/2